MYLRNLLFCLLMSTFLPAQPTFVFGDPLPDAPVLAGKGAHLVGVQTRSFTHKNQLNLRLADGAATPTYDRQLTLEIWYPATTKSEQPLLEYEEVLGIAGDTSRPTIPFRFWGRAERDASPKASKDLYPLVILSHGYVGSRFLMTYLAEHLASWGYVVAAIDHPESTFRDPGPFHATLYHRSRDILFVLDQLDLAAQQENTFSLDASRTALIGYSMGGYGSLNAAGAGFSEQLAAFFKMQTKNCSAIEQLCASHPDYLSQADPRIKAVVAFAPWGKNVQAWTAAGLAGLRAPTLFIAGDQDDISGYENGIKAIFEEAVNASRYLLTFQGARHNVAPNPAPAEALQPGLHIDEYLRYADSVWDTRRMNNINQHFITAFLGLHLQLQGDYLQYLDIAEPEKLWPGFKPRTSVGLELQKGE